MIGEIKDYRQPVVTSVGILLGFILNFLAGWAKGGEGGVADVTDVIILVSVGFAVVLMVIVLFPDSQRDRTRRSGHLLSAHLADLSRGGDLCLCRSVARGAAVNLRP